jgi:hypothetical protein
MSADDIAALMQRMEGMERALVQMVTALNAVIGDAERAANSFDETLDTEDSSDPLREHVAAFRQRVSARKGKR